MSTALSDSEFVETAFSAEEVESAASSESLGAKERRCAFLETQPAQRESSEPL